LLDASAAFLIFSRSAVTVMLSAEAAPPNMAVAIRHAAVSRAIWLFAFTVFTSLLFP